MTPFFRPAPVDSLAPTPSVRPGHGTRVTANALGHAISNNRQGPTFRHAWRPALSGSSVTLNQGTVYSSGGDTIHTPTISVNGRQVPMTGDDKNPPPKIQLDSSIASAAGESWIVLEVEPDEAGEIVKTSRVEIVHTNTPLSHARSLGRQPLTQILWKNGRPLRAIAITSWNLRYLRLLDDVGARHLFQ